MPDFSQLDVVPLLYALLCGGLIGLERERQGRPAGLRTHVIVCLSSTMLILISRHVSTGPEPDDLDRIVFDPNRMGAGIVTGIGFLGAATVLRSGDFLRGLTTAACIWFVAGLGIALGNGDYALGLVGTALVLFVLTFLNRLTSYIEPVIYRRLIVHHTRADVEALTAEIRAILASEKMITLDIASGHDAEGPHELVFYVSLRNELQAPRVTEQVAAREGVLAARWKLMTVPH